MNEYGKIVDNEWLKTSTIRPYVLLDKYIIMPNHFHGIIIIVNNVNICRDTAPVSSCATVEVAESRISRGPPFEQFGRPTSHSIPTIIRSFKAATTKQIREIQKTHRQTVWQPRFYEHIIRNPHELDQTREYIIYNPLKWALDSENP
ncbi:MAG: transposase, partial [Planctomycetota bacterium]